MKFHKDIGILENAYLRNEEVIDIAELSQNWRGGTAGGDINNKTRITDIHDMNQDTEIYKDIFDMYVSTISEYNKEYTHLRIDLQKSEHLRVARYLEGGFYKTHIDGNNRVLSGVLYLNDDYEGGEIYFPKQEFELKPKAGTLILFPSGFTHPHLCKPITKGIKYIVPGWFK